MKGLIKNGQGVNVATAEPTGRRIWCSDTSHTLVRPFITHFVRLTRCSCCYLSDGHAERGERFPVRNYGDPFTFVRAALRTPPDAAAIRRLGHICYKGLT